MKNALIAGIIATGISAGVGAQEINQPEEMQSKYESTQEKLSPKDEEMLERTRKPILDIIEGIPGGPTYKRGMNYRGLYWKEERIGELTYNLGLTSTKIQGRTRIILGVNITF